MISFGEEVGPSRRRLQDHVAFDRSVARVIAQILETRKGSGDMMAPQLRQPVNDKSPSSWHRGGIMLSEDLFHDDCKRDRRQAGCRAQPDQDPGQGAGRWRVQGDREAAAAGEEISLPGFGKFKVKATPEREGRNPSTGATIKIAAAKKLTFAPAKALKDSLNS
jgi:hypothetical protein